MYLSNTNQHLRAKLSGTVATNQPEYTSSWQDITSAGMTLPMSSNAGQLNNTTGVDLVDAPSTSTTRQIVHYTIYNNDTSAVTVEVYKHQAGTDRTIAMVVLQSGDTLQWSRDLGFQVLSQSNQAPVTFQTFTTNGTWTKPSGMKRAMVCCIGAGAGGGSGRCDAAGTARFGGGGGGGGAVAWRELAASDLTTTVAVTVGTGGTGGTGVSTVATNGNAGTAGGATSFGGIVIAAGGSGGSGGTGTSGSSGNGGSPANCVPQYGPYSFFGNNGGNGASGTGASSGTAMQTGAMSCGGGGGGGISNTNVNATAGGQGGSVYSNGFFINGPTSGVSPNGANNQSTFLFFNNSLTSGLGIGTGGAGGYPSLPANAGNGGNYGAGGGGGRASLTGTTSGAGGNGAGGLCVVMEIY